MIASCYRKTGELSILLFLINTLSTLQVITPGHFRLTNKHINNFLIILNVRETICADICLYYYVFVNDYLFVFVL